MLIRVARSGEGDTREILIWDLLIRIVRYVSGDGLPSNEEILSRITRYGIGEKLPSKKEIKELNADVSFFLENTLFRYFSYDRYRLLGGYPFAPIEYIRKNITDLMKVVSYWCNTVGLSSYQQIYQERCEEQIPISTSDIPEEMWKKKLDKIEQEKIKMHLSTYEKKFERTSTEYLVNREHYDDIELAYFLFSAIHYKGYNKPSDVAVLFNKLNRILLTRSALEEWIKEWEGEVILPPKSKLLQKG